MKNIFLRFTAIISLMFVSCASINIRSHYETPVRDFLEMRRIAKEYPCSRNEQDFDIACKKLYDFKKSNSSNAYWYELETINKSK